MHDDNNATVIRSGGNPVYRRKAEHVRVPAVPILSLSLSAPPSGTLLMPNTGRTGISDNELNPETDTDDWHSRSRMCFRNFPAILHANAGFARNRRIRRSWKLHVFLTGLTSSNWNNEWVRLSRRHYATPAQPCYSFCSTSLLFVSYNCSSMWQFLNLCTFLLAIFVCDNIMK